MVELSPNKCNSGDDGFDPDICGGTILDDETIMSAAHCLYAVVENVNDCENLNYTVFIEAGIVIDGSPIGQDIFVQEVIIHPDYKHKTKRNDIAILKLATPLQFNSKVQPACLPYNSFAPDKGVVSGWGLTDADNDYSDSTVLKFLSVKVFSDKKCKHPSIICASAENEGG